MRRSALPSRHGLFQWWTGIRSWRDGDDGTRSDGRHTRSWTTSCSGGSKRRPPGATVLVLAGVEALGKLEHGEADGGRRQQHS
jgi:hypothetical protein